MNNWERASCSEDFKVSSKAKVGKAFPWLSEEQSPPLVRCNPLAARQRKQGNTKDTGECILWQERSIHPLARKLPMETQCSKWPKEQVFLCRVAVLCGLVCVRGKRCLDSWSGSQEKAVTCNSCYSHWICGALSAGLAFEIAFPDAAVSPQRPGWRCAESWPPSFVSSSYFALKDDEKLLEHAFSISLAVSFVAWLLCALVQGITYCSPFLFAFPFLSVLVLGSANPPAKHTQSPAPHAAVRLWIP